MNSCIPIDSQEPFAESRAEIARSPFGLNDSNGELRSEMGELCSNNCVSFCEQNWARCQAYCLENPNNRICQDYSSSPLPYNRKNVETNFVLSFPELEGLQEQEQRGDIVVSSGLYTIENKKITLYGNIVVNGSGILVIKNSILHLHSSATMIIKS